MPIPGSLQHEIHLALGEPNPVLANLQITRCHYLLAQALEQVLGAGAGANFHSWAVWGSRKAGVTIRQEDLDQAHRDGTWVGGLVGGLVGMLSGWYLAFLPVWLPAGALLGAACGIATGRLVIRHSRRRSASLILAGNRTVLADIGLQTARFVDWLTAAGPNAQLSDFLHSLTSQELLQQAFTQYFRAYAAVALPEKQYAAYLGNCFAVWHEHVRLEPYIHGAMPWIIRRCVTKRLLQFDIGALRLAVAQDVPAALGVAGPAPTQTGPPEPALALLRGISGTASDSLTGSAARDWTRIGERMRYVFALFRAYHTEPQVCAAPYQPRQLAAIATGQLPAGAL